MADAHLHLAGAEIDRLRSVRARLGTPATPRELEEALELACAKLVKLEARLQNAQTAARLGHARPRDAERRIRVLLDEINALREEVAEVRATSSDPTRSPLTGGFVLPKHPRGRPNGP
jgi:chromosome segregation ATPase